jgi:hypothetical protein
MSKSPSRSLLDLTEIQQKYAELQRQQIKEIVREVLLEYGLIEGAAEDE